jgi:glucosamine--fructose-6-phosphate aminotransferase (isomerizing)
MLDDRCLSVFISQSGETADTLAAERESRSQGAKALAICNVRGSMLTRECDGTIYTHAGPEIGVASTKAFTSQIVALTLLALKLGRVRKTIADAEFAQLIRDLYHIPAQMERYLNDDGPVVEIAKAFHLHRDFLYLGRGVNYPIALEGALKLKEISYIHAEAYAAGEMKHGPIALIDEKMPVVVIATKCPTYDKVISNLEQVRARDGMVIAIASEGDDAIAGKANDVIYVPDLGEYLTAVLVTVPLQLLAYHVALLKGTDVDQPRNLAKSVTVE